MLYQRERIYYVFLHSTFGRIMFLPFFYATFGDEVPLLSVMYLFLNGMTFGIACFTAILSMA